MNTIGKKLEPDDQPDSGQTPETPLAAPDTVLGSLKKEGAQSGGISTPGTQDTTGAQGTPGAQGGPTSPTPDAGDTGSAGGTSGTDDDDDPLILPKGAIVALRKSGGLRFTSRTVAVHRDGQITRSSSTYQRDLGQGTTNRLTNDQLSAIKVALSQAGLGGPTPKTSGSQSPDAYAYEIAARMGTKQYAVEVFDGSIPEAIKPLIRLLSQLLV